MALVELYECHATYEVPNGYNKDGSTAYKTVNCKVKAEDAHKDIEVEQIMGYCDSIAEEAEPLQKLNSNLIDVANSYISTTSLCVEGTGIEKILDDCNAECVEKYQAIKDITSEIKEEAEKLFNQLQTKYNDQAKAKCSEKHGS